MRLSRSLLAGFAGAVALNILHETIRQFDADAPRIEMIGEEALSKAIKSAGMQPPTGDSLYATTLAADIVSNGFYFSLIGMGKEKNILSSALVYGAAAGIGALVLTKPLGLNDAPVTRTTKTKLMTVGYYVFGALVAGWLMQKPDRLG